MNMYIPWRSSTLRYAFNMKISSRANSRCHNGIARLSSPPLPPTLALQIHSSPRCVIFLFARWHGAWETLRTCVYWKYADGGKWCRRGGGGGGRRRERERTFAEAKICVKAINLWVFHHPFYCCYYFNVKRAFRDGSTRNCIYFCSRLCVCAGRNHTVKLIFRLI